MLAKKMNKESILKNRNRNVHLCTPISNHQPNTSAEQKAHKITPGMEIIRDITPHFMRQKATKHKRKK
jgi:hypothetical protein